MTSPPDGAQIRLSELMAALSIATDLNMGRPQESAITSCLISVRLGERIGLDSDRLRDIYYFALLRYIGCTAETHAFADLFGDEVTLRRALATIDLGRTGDRLALALRLMWQARADASVAGRLGHVLRGVGTAAEVKDWVAGQCEVAQRLAGRIGFGAGLIEALGQVYERWDGAGPLGVRGRRLALSVRVVGMIQDVLAMARLGGREAAVEMVRDRRGRAYDPEICDHFLASASSLLADLEDEPSWDTLIAMEPGPQEYLSPEQFDAACAAIADSIDIKSPNTVGHSPRVAALVAGAAQRCSLPAADVMVAWRAALLHEVGRMGVPTAVWIKRGPLSDREKEQVRLHPYLTERILARPAALAPLGRLGSLHHERLDGSGYHRGVGAAQLPALARILIAANAYQSMIEPRPHRPPVPPEQAADALRAEVRLGRQDGQAVDAVLAAAGHRGRQTRREAAAGLTEREIEVLRLIARGHANKNIAVFLRISQKTVDHHIQHIYDKVGVSTRAAATLWAVEHDLLGLPV